MRRFCSQFVRDESGATAIEYGLVLSGITIAILGTLNALSSSVKSVLFDVILAAAGP